MISLPVQQENVFDMNIDALHYLDMVSSIALELPGTVASTSYGTPAFKVKGKLFARFKEDGKTLVIYTYERDKWMKARPKVYFITDHYKDHPYMLIDLATVPVKELKALVTAAWELRTVKDILKKDKKTGKNG